MFISTMLFDFGGTLDSNGISWLNRFYPLYLKEGIPSTPEEFSKAFYDSDDHLATRHRLAGLGLVETLRLQVRDVLQCLGQEDEETAERIVQAFARESREHFNKARPILERLKRRCSLGIASNFYGNLEAILDQEDLLRYFSVVADSGKVGFSKPDPELFLYAMNPLGAGPARTCMVGDSLARDMKGAETLGLSHAWLRGDRVQQPACCDQAVVLGSLGEIEACLEPSALV